MWVIPNGGKIPNQKNRKAATTVGIPQTTSLGDTGREEETKSQVINGKVVLTHRGGKRENDTNPEKYDQWIFDCGATDTVTHDPHDFGSLSTPVKTHIEITNGELVTVQRRGLFVFPKKLKLSNCLYVPALSSKLLFVSQVTKEMNCVVLMFSTFYLLQDILMKEIIGRGTEHGGLDYVDDVAHKGHAMPAHGTVTRQLWL